MKLCYARSRPQADRYQFREAPQPSFAPMAEPTKEQIKKSFNNYNYDGQRIKGLLGYVGAVGYLYRLDEQSLHKFFDRLLAHFGQGRAARS